MDPRVRQLYRVLLFMGREYPTQSGGYSKFRAGLKSKFQTTKITTENDMIQALARGEYVQKELKSLYFLMRYRHLKRNYEIR